MMRILTLALAAGLLATFGPPDGVAQPPDDVITLDLPGVTLREALALVFDGSGVVIEWRDSAAADQIIKGQFAGSAHEVATGLMSRTDFVISYDGEGSIARIVITGRNLTPPEAPALPVRVRSKRPIETVKLTAGQRRQQVREKLLKKMQTTNEAVRQRLASLPPGWQLLRTQAIMTVSSVHRGNIPLLPLPPRRGR
jgi:hypothetical protein